MSAHSDSVASAAAKLTPPLTVGGATIVGLQLQDWVLILTGAYACLQIGFLLWDRLFKPWRDRRGR